MTWCKQTGPVPIFTIALGLLMVSLVGCVKRLTGEETHTCMRHNIVDDFSGCVLGLIVLAVVVPVLYAGSIHHEKAIAVHKAAGNAVKHSVSHTTKKHGAR